VETIISKIKSDPGSAGVSPASSNFQIPTGRRDAGAPRKFRGREPGGGQRDEFQRRIDCGIVAQQPDQLCEQHGDIHRPVVCPESLNYQWQKNGTNLVNGGNLSGATNSTLTIANLSDADAAIYSAVVGDATSSVTISMPH